MAFIGVARPINPCQLLLVGALHVPAASVVRLTIALYATNNATTCQHHHQVSAAMPIVPGRPWQVTPGIRPAYATRRNVGQVPKFLDAFDGSDKMNPESISGTSSTIWMVSRTTRRK